MSQVAHRACAPPPPQHGLVAVIEGLLVLRAEIDVVLAQLAAQSTLIPMAVAAGAPALGLPVDAASDSGSADANPGILAASEVALAGDPGGPGGQAIETLAEPAEMVGPTILGVSEVALEAGPGGPGGQAIETLAEPAETVSPTILEVREVALEAGPGADGIEALAEPAETMSPTAVAALDGTPTVLDGIELAPDEPLFAAPAPAAAEAVEDRGVQCGARAETAGDSTVIMGVAAAAEGPGEAQEPPNTEERPSAGADQMEAAGAGPAGGATLGAVHANATVGAATIVPFLAARLQECRGGPSTRRARARSTRHWAAMIAAALFVLLTAAGAMLMANRTALGGVPLLAWLAPSPPATVPSGLEWLWQRLRMGATRSPKARAVPANPLLHNEVSDQAVTSGS